MAARDLRSIDRYTIREWGIRQADRYAEQLEITMKYLLSKRTPDWSARMLRPSLLKARSGKHYIFYERSSVGIFVSRVLHTAMDVSRKRFPSSISRRA